MSAREVLAVLDKLGDSYRLAAELQLGRAFGSRNWSVCG